jgi:1,4-dihydroxy-2-naphthoyl-CoA hydrolase
MIDPQIHTLERLNKSGENTMLTHLGIEIIDVGTNYVSGKMPVDHRTIQPAGLLHGGANVVLAESLGSIAANCYIDTSKQMCVGLEINANHIRAVKSGYVYGKAEPVHIGRSTQIWEIKIHDDQNRLSCVSRLTLSVINR